MRTDAYGREFAPAQPAKPSFAKTMQPFFTGAAIGFGFCLIMGSPLQALDDTVTSAFASEAANSALVLLPQRLLALRQAALDGDIAEMIYPERRDDEELLRGKWRAVQDALASAWSNSGTER